MDLLAHTAVESERFVEAIRKADANTPVPTCPEWNADDLLWHLTEVQHFWSEIVGKGLADPSSYEPPTRPDGRDGLLDSFAHAHGSLVAALTGKQDADPAWSWHEPDQTVGFTRRRQAHEALIHRIDAELTIAADSTIDAELAADGVLEVLDVMYGSAPSWTTVTEDGPVGTIRCTDLDIHWAVQIRRLSGTSPETGQTYADEPVLAIVDSAASAFDISGTAADLDRWLWRRPTAGPINRTGDAAVFEAVIDNGIH